MDPIHLFFQWSCKVLVAASLIEGIQKGGHHFLMGNPPTVVSLVYCMIAAVAPVRPSTSQDRICTSSMIWPSLFTSAVSEQGADLQLQFCSCKSQI